jgi:hypothetical protein
MIYSLILSNMYDHYQGTLIQKGRVECLSGSNERASHEVGLDGGTDERRSEEAIHILNKLLPNTKPSSLATLYLYTYATLITT